MMPPCDRYVLLSSGFEARVNKVTIQPRFAASHAAARPPSPLPITRTSVCIASFIRNTSSRLDLETQIYRRGRMRQCADRNPVHSCFGEFAHILERDSTGSFRANFSRRVLRSYLLDCLTGQGWTHVIEQDDIRADHARSAQ